MSADSSWSTGSEALDAMMRGGVPRERVIAITGTAGSGKTILAAQIVAAQAAQGIRSVFVAFEQRSERLRDDLSGFDWSRELGDARVEIIEACVPAQAVISGDFDLGALISILESTVERLDARIVVLDGIDALLSMLTDEEAERRELFRIGTWLSDNGLTGIVTTKSSATWPRSLERAALVDYQSDGVIGLEATRSGTVVARTLRISKLRGTAHDGSVVPLVIDESGINVAHLSSPERVAAERTSERLPSGIAELDDMLQGGYLKGSATLISGPPGAAKTSLASAFTSAVGRERAVLYVTFDETETELLFHMSSIGYDLAGPTAEGRVRILALRSGLRGPERHVFDILRAVDEAGAEVVVIDPISALNAVDHPLADLTTHYLFHELDRRGVTTLCTSLTEDGTGSAETSRSKIATIADNWLHLTYVALAGARNRTLTVVKARATANSNQVRELVISHDGATLLPVYLSDGDVLVGSARAQREAADRRAAWERDVEFRNRRAAAQNDLDGLRAQAQRLEREIAARHADLEGLDLGREQERERERDELSGREKARMLHAAEMR